MKSKIFLSVLFIALWCNTNAQTVKDTIASSNIYPSFTGTFSAGESWEIHKAAYLKQLKSQNLSQAEIDQRMKAYDQKKEEFIERSLQLRKKAEELRANAEVQRKQAEVQRQAAEEMRRAANKERKNAEVLRKQAEQHRKQIMAEQRNARELQLMAEKQRIKAEGMRKQAELLRKKAEKIRKSMEVVATDNISITEASIDKPIYFKLAADSRIHINLSGSLKAGKAEMELIDPDGKTEANLIIDYAESEKSSDELTIVSSKGGSISKTIDLAQKGKWQLKISTYNASGDLRYSIVRYKEDYKDE